MSETLLLCSTVAYFEGTIEYKIPVYIVIMGIKMTMTAGLN